MAQFQRALKSVLITPRPEHDDRLVGVLTPLRTSVVDEYEIEKPSAVERHG